MALTQDGLSRLNLLDDLVFSKSKETLKGNNLHESNDMQLDTADKQLKESKATSNFDINDRGGRVKSFRLN